MKLATFDPFTALPFRTIRDLDRWIDRPTVSGWAPRLDAFDRSDALVVRVALPGVDPAEVDITLEDQTLTVSGTRALDPEATETTEPTETTFHRREIAQGTFKRSITLGDAYDAEAITATAANGIIEISVPRSPAVLPRKVKVEIG